MAKLHFTLLNGTTNPEDFHNPDILRTLTRRIPCDEVQAIYASYVRLTGVDLEDTTLLPSVSSEALWLLVNNGVILFGGVYYSDYRVQPAP